MRPRLPRSTRRAIQTLDRTSQQTSEWRLAIGHAIDVLRSDTVALFEREPHAPDFSIFSEDLVIVDARLPSFRLHGLPTYQRILSTLKWSVSTTCERSRYQIMAMQPPINDELHMRWRLHLWPRDVLAPAKDFLAPAFGPGAFIANEPSMPLVVEGYSRYEFNPWTAKIVKHTIDITNPPMLIVDLLKVQTGSFSWMPTPSMTGVRLPNMMPQSTQEDTLRPVAAWIPSLPQTCEDDFECNGGRANFPLHCCEVPLLGNFCCEPKDFEPSPQDPAYVPLPVPSDPWRQ